MARSIDQLVDQIRALEAEVQVAYEAEREDIHLIIERGRVRFSEAVVGQQRLHKIGLRRMVFDRGDLPYLNAIQKFNCFYCSYGNGVSSYAREIAARTKQHFCPIKHARRIRAAHDRYPKFFEYGDAETYREGLERLQKKLLQANET